MLKSEDRKPLDVLLCFMQNGKTRLCFAVLKMLSLQSKSGLTQRAATVLFVKAVVVFFNWQGE
jgi:hypothetical protein